MADDIIIPQKDRTTPQPPRWRFVKTLKDYSSKDAGIAIEGKSAQELGSAYKAPDDIENKFDTDNEEVGQLSIAEKDEDVLVVLEDGVDKIIETEEETDNVSRVWVNSQVPIIMTTGKVSKDTSCSDDDDSAGIIKDIINDPNLIHEKEGLGKYNIPAGEPRKRRLIILLLLLLLLLIISTIIGTVLSKRKTSKESRVFAAMSIPTNDTIDKMPSSRPSTTTTNQDLANFNTSKVATNPGSVVVVRPHVPWEDDKDITEQTMMGELGIDSLIPVDSLTTSPTTSPNSIASDTQQPYSSLVDLSVSDSPSKQSSSNPVLDSPSKQTQQPVTQQPPTLLPLPSLSPVKSSSEVIFFNPAQSPSQNPIDKVRNFDF